jgi:ADP-glucose pyrophosphorylase
MLVVDGCRPAVVERLQDLNTMEPLWIMETDLINAKGDHVGRINKEKQVITRWIFEEPTATATATAVASSTVAPA